MYPLNTQKTPKIRKSVRTSLKKDLRCGRCLLLEKKRDSATRRISLQKITKKTKDCIVPKQNLSLPSFPSVEKKSARIRGQRPASGGLQLITHLRRGYGVAGRSPRPDPHGRGCGVGRDLGVALGGAVAVAVAVGVGDGGMVSLAVGVGVGDGDGVGDPGELGVGLGLGGTVAVGVGDGVPPPCTAVRMLIRPQP